MNETPLSETDIFVSSLNDSTWDQILRINNSVQNPISHKVNDTEHEINAEELRKADNIFSVNDSQGINPVHNLDQSRHEKDVDSAELEIWKNELFLSAGDPWEYMRIVSLVRNRQDFLNVVYDPEMQRSPRGMQSLDDIDANYLKRYVDIVGDVVDKCILDALRPDFDGNFSEQIVNYIEDVFRRHSKTTEYQREEISHNLELMANNLVSIQSPIFREEVVDLLAKLYGSFTSDEMYDSLKILTRGSGVLKPEAINSLRRQFRAELFGIQKQIRRGSGKFVQQKSAVSALDMEYALQVLGIDGVSNLR